jgi:uncharacterized protein YqeY
MSIEERLTEEMKLAMKAGEKEKLGAVRMLRSKLKDARIDKRADLTDAEVLEILGREAKRRKESIDMYTQAGRDELAAKEKFELDVIQSYLPEQLSEEDLDAIIASVITEIAATSIRDMGKVMGAVMGKVKGQADGKLVQQRVQVALNKLA